MSYRKPLRALLAAAALAVAVQAHGSMLAKSVRETTDNDIDYAGAQLHCAPLSLCTPRGEDVAGGRFIVPPQGGAHRLPGDPGGEVLTPPATGLRVDIDGAESRWTANAWALDTAPKGYETGFGDLSGNGSPWATPLESRVAPSTVDASPVPVPAAVWLFGSGLIALSAMARRGLCRRR